ncbi:hypothetical protein ACHAXA_002890 [Cyclostephanos tholiformis]|uniref:Uncharacterized protein n=1 Tax=Cyclostephanos tholiformis TaxID=382380 RepID=A0ABD3SG65_9STRA
MVEWVYFALSSTQSGMGGKVYVKCLALGSLVCHLTNGLRSRSS